MKKTIALVLALLCLMTMCACRKKDEPKQDPPPATNKPVNNYPPDPAKPVIYLYPQTPTQVKVQLDFNGRLTSVYPAYSDGWTVTAQPDGTLTDESGREYYCLFWEGESFVPYELREGFCVRGEDTRAFLENALRHLGLTDKEANEFIIYWLPKMEHNPYNVISFLQEQYTDNARLTVTPAPDSLLRVFMAWQAADAPVELPEQKLEGFEREGFAVVEWGGAEIK